MTSNTYMPLTVDVVERVTSLSWWVAEHTHTPIIWMAFCVRIREQVYFLFFCTFRRRRRVFGLCWRGEANNTTHNIHVLRRTYHTRIYSIYLHLWRRTQQNICGSCCLLVIALFAFPLSHPPYLSTHTLTPLAWRLVSFIRSQFLSITAAAAAHIRTAHSNWQSEKFKLSTSHITSWQL